jgi:allantoate deiminase
MRDCHREISSWLRSLGIPISIDAAGNLRAFYPGADSHWPRLLIGSHLDTVPDAGAFDGILGVVLAVSLLEMLGGKKLPFGIELVGFSEEEGVRYGVPFLGSRAFVGRLDDEILRRVDSRGISVRQAIEDFGLNPEEIPLAVAREDILGYLEFHIEQGPVLDERKLPLGIVDCIVGQTRMEFTFSGRANHAGTTPMHLRRDALVCAAEFVSAVEREARATSGLVATVGSLQAAPGAANVIAGEAIATLDARHVSDKDRSQAAERLAASAAEIAHRRGLKLESRVLLDQPAVAMNSFLSRQIEAAMRKVGVEPYRMASGAGHDAMILAEKVPAAMIFLRSPGGISHHPLEAVLTEDVASALEVGMQLLENLAVSKDFLGRTSRA